MCKAVGFRVTVRGEIPQGGFIAPNHLSYMDILVLSSLLPQAFLSKKEVDSWPVIGMYTRMAGTLYIDRHRRSGVAEQEAGFAEVLDSGLSMTVFLEGTSTDGRTVLPFRASLLQPLVANNWSVTPAYLSYECDEGEVTRDVCWWGDMGFFEHIWRMFKAKGVRATIVFGKTRRSGTDRKQLAADLYQDVVRLSESL